MNMKRFFRSQAGFPTKSFVERCCPRCYPERPKPKCLIPKCPYRTGGCCRSNIVSPPPPTPQPQPTPTPQPAPKFGDIWG